MSDQIGGGESRAGEVDEELEGSREPSGEPKADLATDSGSSTNFERHDEKNNKTTKQQQTTN